MKRRIAVIALVLGASAAGAAGTAPAPVLAACTSGGPTLGEVRATATTIVVGRVVWEKPGAPDGPPRTWFDVRADRVLRGSPGAIVQVRGLRRTGCPVDAVAASVGDRLVLALGVRMERSTLGAAWWLDANGRIVDSTVDAGPNGPRDLAGLLAALAGVPDTAGPGGDEPPILPWITFVAGALGGAATIGQLGRLRGRSRRRTSRT